MPRSTKKLGNSRFSACAHPLSATAKAKLLDLLGSADDTAIFEIEKSLGLYVNGRANIDNIPRPANYVAAFKPINKDATKLLDALWQLNDYFSDQVASRDVDLDAIEASLAQLVSVSGRIVAEHKAQKSIGRTPNNALAEIIRRLRHTFRAKYSGPVMERRKSGGVEFRSETEKKEIQFVETALVDARILRSGDTTAKVALLFKDPRCAMPEERGTILSRLADKSARSRRQKGTA